MRLSSGNTILRGDLRLEQRGSTLSGSLALESSDDPPVAIREGTIQADGTLAFVVDAPGATRFTGRRDGAGLIGEAMLDPGRVLRWTAQRLSAGAEFYAALPRFRAAQLTIGRNATEVRLPGAWLAALPPAPAEADRAGPLAVAAGLTPIPPDSLGEYGFLPSLGLVRRAEFVVAMTGALTAVRAGLPAGDQDQFDAIFRPRGDWLVDLHAAALGSARRRFQRLSWEDARPALAAAGLLPAALPPGAAELPVALYRLAVLRETDSTAFEAARERLLRTGGVSGSMAGALLDGYREAAAWQSEAVTFLLGARWVRGAEGRTSLAGLMRAAWAVPDLPVPTIRARYFGIPEAMPRIGIPAEVVGRIVVPQNWTGGEWVDRRGAAAVLDVLRGLRLEIGTNTTLDADGPWIVTSVRREAAGTPSGFLESTDEILEDPGNPPLFAVATALHEWQHLLMERHRLLLAAGGTLQDDGAGLQYVASDLFLAEGLSEWESERILAPLVAELPMLGVGEAQKLAVLESFNPADPHVVGLRMMRALVAALGTPAAARALVLAHGDNPFAVAAAVPAWQGVDVADREFPARGQRRLIPETMFTIEDGVGDVVGTRIRVLADGAPGR
ncbi:MAG TPA: hypothetical protein PKA66_03590 [Gemmatimonadales bacterium]|nr:hypothetical protein [Gemmatimonadales bacterium]